MHSSQLSITPPLRCSRHNKQWNNKLLLQLLVVVKWYHGYCWWPLLLFSKRFSQRTMLVMQYKVTGNWNCNNFPKNPMWKFEPVYKTVDEMLQLWQKCCSRVHAQIFFALCLVSVVICDIMTDLDLDLSRLLRNTVSGISSQLLDFLGDLSTIISSYRQISRLMSVTLKWQYYQSVLEENMVVYIEER